MPRLRLCQPDKHHYKPTKDVRYEKCEVCKDIFPCKTKCEHLDCCYVRGEEIPEYWRNLLAAMGIEMDTKGLVPWSERDGGSKTAGRGRRNVRKLRQKGVRRSSGQVEELEHDDSLVRDLSRSGGEVAFSTPDLEADLGTGSEEGPTDRVEHGRRDVGSE